MKRFARNFALALVIPTVVALCLALTPASQSEAAASGLTLAEACAADGTATLYFGWQGTSPAAAQLWLDVGRDNLWRPGSFVNAGPLHPETHSYDNWGGFAAGGTYYIRLNQLMWNGTWDPSGTVSFTTFGCSDRGVAFPSGGTGGVNAAPAGSVSSTGNGPASNSVSSSSSASPYGTAASTSVGEPASSSNPSTSNRTASDYIGSSNPPADFCSFAPCIPNFWNGQGTVIICKDGMYSKSGGRSGSCSSHHGNA